MPARGVAHHWSKLNPRKVLMIRDEYKTERAAGRGIRQTLIYLGKMYNVSPSNIHAVVNRKTWKDVEDEDLR